MHELTDWKRIFLNDMPLSFLLEVAFRSAIMFIIILVTLRASGKRGIKQLSVFELVLIIGLGSAAGDPMFYEDVGILPAITVFTVVILFYLGVTKLTDKLRWFEKVLEGEPVYIIQESKIIVDAFKKLGLSQDELFSGLRAMNVEHLGQVKTVLVETSGQFSILFNAHEDVKPGLPIFPKPLSEKTKGISATGTFACCTCGEIKHLQKGFSGSCTTCSSTEWVKPVDTKRIA